MEYGGVVKEIMQTKLRRDIFGLIAEATPWKDKEVIAQEMVDEVKLQILRIPR